MAADRTQRRAVRRYDAARAKGRVHFDAWFPAQFGPPPHAARTLGELESRERDAWRAYNDAEHARWEREVYEVRRDAALKAWAAQAVHAQEARRGVK